MKRLTDTDVQEIGSWMHRNARPVDLKVWQHYFEGGPAEAVLAELAFYQNADGGFGHALEPDCWNPASSPYTTLCGARMLLDIGAADGSQPLWKGVLRYFDACGYMPGVGWPFSIPSNDAYPHAPWWTYSPEANAYESIGLTAEIAGIIFLYGDKDSGLYGKALDAAGMVIGKLRNPGRYGDMGVGGYCALLEAIPKAGLEARLDCAFLAEKLAGLVHDTIQRDTAKWAFYGVRPSNYIRTPESPYYQDNADILEAELDYLIDTRPGGGVWPIPWSWFENNEKYPKEFAVSENWWKAVKATEKMLLLKRFGRLGESA